MTPAAPTILVNHLGFRPDDPLKRALLPIPKGRIGWLGVETFNVIEVSALIRHPLGSPEWLAAHHPVMGRIEQTPLGDFVVCDCSPLTARGGYQIHHEGRRSVPFLVYRDLWKRCFRLLLEWYRIASCGEAVPGWHEACHLDDARIADTGEPRDLVGGWHDAGDLRKWTSTMAFVTHGLTDFLREQPDPTAVGVDPDLVHHQLERAASYLLKTLDPDTGLPWHSIASDVRRANESGVWTDNRPNSGDEREARRDCSEATVDHMVRALAGLAVRYAAQRSDERNRLIAAARRVFASGEQRFGTEPDMALDATLALWEAEPSPEWRDRTVEGLRRLLRRQVTGPAFDQSRLSGFFVRDGTLDENEGFRGRGGRNLFRYARRVRHLSRALLTWPGHPESPRWKEALLALLEGCLEPMIRRSPFRVLPACLCLDTDPVPGARPLDGRLCFRYFGIHAEGNNGELAQAAEALALASRALDQPRWAALGQKQIEWIYGFNPFDTCMMTGLGYSTAAVFSPFVGQIPGAIVNGILGNPETDEPRLAMDRQLSPMLMEYWSVHTAAVLTALATLENQPLT